MRASVGVRLGMHAVGATALLLVFLVSPVRAQAGASTGLSGQVTDSTGGAIPGVTVTLTHLDTGRERVVTTGGNGDWEARFLSPGTYRITFELSGFRPMRREGVAVSTAEMSTVNGLAGDRRPRRGGGGRGQRRDGLVGIDDRREDARSEGARVAPDLRQELHAAAGHRAGRIRRHQRPAVQRQRVDLSQRERRPHHQQQLRLQRHRRDQPTLLQQPGQRVGGDH